MSVMLSRQHQMIRTGTTMTPTIFSHPYRQPQKFRPFKAFQHFRKLIADKEDTEQVFHIFENLPRKGFMDDARAFVTSDFGRKLMEREPYLPDLLDDHRWIDELPEGTDRKSTRLNSSH